ncbi:hypothetical protein VLK31_03520 [Variovorax sp. H27-G14]|uniref:hypothetical protein n=1 Tax=Variovorax sp. H27-G14 TaxID=3111914 RepID=UPI0038FC9608
MKQQRTLWLLVASAATALLVFGGWLGARQAGEILQADSARRQQPVAPAEALVLPLPPAFHTDAIGPRESPRQANEGGSETATPTGEPPPGGYPVDVAVEMWEAWLKQPRKIGDRALTAEAWVVTGVVVRANVQEVIVQRGNDPKPQFRRVGDTLPGGARIVWVRPNAIGLITPQRERISLPVRP